MNYSQQPYCYYEWIHNDTVPTEGTDFSSTRRGDIIPCTMQGNYVVIAPVTIPNELVIVLTVGGCFTLMCIIIITGEWIHGRRYSTNYESIS